jgi:hypothetical protein
MSKDEEKKILETDLRHITRSGAGVLMVVVSLEDLGRRDVWLRAGGATLRWHKNGAELRAYLRDGATDFEHDSAFAFTLPLIGLQMDYGFGVCGSIYFEGWVSPDPEMFRVPGPGYDPLSSSYTSTLCSGKDCGGEPHRIVASENYSGPPHDKSVDQRQALVAGRRVSIQLYPWRPEKTE